MWFNSPLWVDSNFKKYLSPFYSTAFLMKFPKQKREYGVMLSVTVRKAASYLFQRFRASYIIWKRTALPSEVNASRVPFTAPTACLIFDSVFDAENPLPRDMEIASTNALRSPKPFLRVFLRPLDRFATQGKTRLKTSGIWCTLKSNYFTIKLTLLNF